MRLLPLIVATAGAAGILSPTSARAQDTLARAKAVRGIDRLSPMAFPQLPDAVKRALVARRCTVPQAWLKTPHNVVRGRFIDARHRDWAVLCSPEGQDWAYILVFHRGSTSRVDSLAPKKLTYLRYLERVTPTVIREMAEPHADPLPRCLDHDGLNDHVNDDTSTAWYRLHGRWQDLGIGGMFNMGVRQPGYGKPCAGP